MARALDLIGRDGVTDHDLAKIIVDSETDLRAALRWFDSMFPRYARDER